MLSWPAAIVDGIDMVARVLRFVRPPSTVGFDPKNQEFRMWNFPPSAQAIQAALARAHIHTVTYTSSVRYEKDHALTLILFALISDHPHSAATAPPALYPLHRDQTPFPESTEPSQYGEETKREAVSVSSRASSELTASRGHDCQSRSRPATIAF